MGPVERRGRVPSSNEAGAVVVAGGAAHRMGGVDKLALTVGGAPLLDRVLKAVRPLCRRLVVAGQARDTAVPGVDFVQEHPPGGGPLPGVMVGFEALGDAEPIVVLAGDLPMVTTAHLARLMATLEQDEDGTNQAVAAMDERGLPNPLLAVYRPGALRSAASCGPVHGGAATLLLPEKVALVDLGDHATLNVNRPADLWRAEALLAMAGAGDGSERGSPS